MLKENINKFNLEIEVKVNIYCTFPFKMLLKGWTKQKLFHLAIISSVFLNISIIQMHIKELKY